MFFQTVLKRPHPLTLSGRHNRVVASCAALFMLSFLSVFQPFHLRFYPGDEKLLVILGFTLITGLGLALNLWLWPRQFPDWFSVDYWSLQRELLWIGANVAVLAGAAFCFKVVLGFYPPTLERILTGLGATTALSIIPISLYELVKMVLIRPQIPAKSGIAIPPAGLVFLDAQRGEESLEIPGHHILVISSDANYVDILWQSGPLAELQQTRLRATLRHVEGQLADFPDFVRCHRAHIVNLRRMQRFCGNQQGGKLYIEGTGLSVPVSRRYVPLIQAAFRAGGVPVSYDA